MSKKKTLPKTLKQKAVSLFKNEKEEYAYYLKEYNKKLKSGSITVSFTASVKNQAGEYETQYFNGLIPAKLAQNAKDFINTKQLAKISGIASPAKKGYISFTILEIEQYQKQQKSDDNEVDIDDFPF